MERESEQELSQENKEIFGLMPDTLPIIQETTETNELQERLMEAEEARDQFKELYQRSQADLANFRRRKEEEQVEFQRSANGQLILKLLPVIDDLERALQAGLQGQLATQETMSSEPGWLEGVRLIARKFRAFLEAVGVKPIEAHLGQPFNPWEHEVVGYQETLAHPDGHILSIVLDGYKMGDKVLRPAQIAVAKTPPEEAKISDPLGVGGGGEAAIQAAILKAGNGEKSQRRLEEEAVARLIEEELDEEV